MNSSRGSEQIDRILVVESDPSYRRILSAELSKCLARDVDIEATEAKAEGLTLTRGGAFGLIILGIETIGGMESIGEFARLNRAAIILATTQSGSVSGAVAALRAGADDFVIKPFSAEQIVKRFDECKKRRRPSNATASRADNVYAKEREFEDFIGSSPIMRGVYDQIERIARSRAPAFITGESGTGKELCARAIHARSQRANGPFIAINCSAIPRDLMESEIFGHVRGAFTGAVDDRDGAAVQADGGTLFLDEIGEMDLDLQVKLLRFVQTGVVRQVGGSTTRAVDVRFVCATNREPYQEIESGRFRQDLFYRLHVLPIAMPPLRERQNDILTLARHFLTRFSAEENKRFEGFDAGAETRLLANRWPGNVRQLENVIRQIVVLHDGALVHADMLPIANGEPVDSKGFFSNPPVSRPRISNAVVPFWRQEQSIIEDALAMFGGNISRAAAALEIAPSTIYRKRQAWASKRPD